MPTRARKLYYDVNSGVIPNNNFTLAPIVITDGSVPLLVPGVIGVPGNLDRYGNLLPVNATIGAGGVGGPKQKEATTAHFTMTSLVAGPPNPPAGASSAADYSNFFALMPGDNAATIAANAPVLFPQNGPTTGVILRTGPGTFNLPAIGTYEITWQVSVSEPGQLELFLNGAQLPNTVVGRATGTSEIVGSTLITTTVINSILEVRNPAGNATALTITPTAGGTHAVSATLDIKLLVASAGGGGGLPAGQPAILVTFVDAAQLPALVPVTDPATVLQVAVSLNFQGMSGAAISGTLYVQKQWTAE